MRLIKKLKRCIKSIACFFTTENHLLDNSLKKILYLDYKSGNIKVIYDIGAHQGDWADEIKATLPDTKLISFEANPDHAEALKSKGHEFHIGLLSKPGVTECEFYSPEPSATGSTGGSYYKEVTPIYNDLEGKKLKATTLDALVASNHMPQPDLIKIDTQGSELDIISGGDATFRSAKWIIMELPVVRYNVGAPEISEYLNLMNEIGFVPINVTEIHKFGSILIQLDFLFLNKKNVDEATLKSLCI